MEDLRKEAKLLLEKCAKERQIELIAKDLIFLQTCKDRVKEVEERIEKISKRTDPMESITENYFTAWLGKQQDS